MSGVIQSSLSMKPIHSPRAKERPMFFAPPCFRFTSEWTARNLPGYSFSKRCRICQESSVEQSSTAMISISSRVWLTREFRQYSSFPSRLYYKPVRSHSAARGIPSFPGRAPAPLRPPAHIRAAAPFRLTHSQPPAHIRPAALFSGRPPPPARYRPPARSAGLRHFANQAQILRTASITSSTSWSLSA